MLGWAAAGSTGCDFMRRWGAQQVVMIATWENTKVGDNWVFSHTESVARPMGGRGQLIFPKGSVMVDIFNCTGSRLTEDQGSRCVCEGGSFHM